MFKIYPRLQFGNLPSTSTNEGKCAFPQDEIFQKLKEALSSAPVLIHYNLSYPTRWVVDASPWALGAVLLQQHPDSPEYRLVAFGSRSLTETETKYGHIEKEALAIVFGCEQFHIDT